MQSGFAILRYDGPGWGGQSTQDPGFETLESRAEEAIVVVKYLQSRPNIQADKVGLWGISQGGWICQMAAAASEDVASIIPDSGPGVTPAEQEVYRVEEKSKAASFDSDEIAKAVLMRRLMIDTIFSKPLHQEVNQSESQRLGDGHWEDMMAIVYSMQPVDSKVEFNKILELLNTIKVGEDFAPDYFDAIIEWLQGAA